MRKLSTLALGAALAFAALPALAQTNSTGPEKPQGMTTNPPNDASPSGGTGSSTNRSNEQAPPAGAGSRALTPGQTTGQPPAGPMTGQPSVAPTTKN